MIQEIQCASESQTHDCAAALAAGLTVPCVILLKGDLGAGKTSFARAMIRSLNGQPDTEVPSPTFTLLQTYDTPRGPVHHYDLYRLSDVAEIYELGWEESLESAITIAEWPERLGSQTPINAIGVDIKTDPSNPDGRQITITQPDNPGP